MIVGLIIGGNRHLGGSSAGLLRAKIIKAADRARRHHMGFMLQEPGRAAMPQPARGGPPRLLCDEMLQRLGRWLRAAGYDTLIAQGGQRDRDLLARALREGRLLVTRDRKLGEHKGAPGAVVVLRANGLEECVAEMTERLGIDWLLAPFTRCVLCNSALAPLPPALEASIPAALSTPRADVSHCPLCWKVYWSGGHVDRMRRRLEAWRRVAGPWPEASRPA